MFKKLRIKFIITLMILLTSLVAIVFSVVYIVSARNGENLLFSETSEVINSIKVNINGQISTRSKSLDDSVIAIYNPVNSEIYVSTNLSIGKDEVQKIVDDIIAKNKVKGFVESNQYEFAFMRRNEPYGMQIVLHDASFYKASMVKLLIALILIGLVSLFILFVISVIIARKAIRPVEEAYNSQKRFIADASHELKTPLAVIKTNLDVLNANERDTIINQKKWLEYIDFQTDRMSKLVNNLLYLAKADNNESLGVLSKFNLSDAIMNMILTFEAVIYENNLELNCDISENIYFKGDREGINQLILILLDNAVKHSYKKTVVHVSLKQEKHKIYLYVQNVGDTIPKEDLGKIFERFYRVDKSRARERGGYGLGLSIAMSIVDKYKGKISVESQDSHTKFIVELNSLSIE